MAREGYAAGGNAVYKVNQTTGKVTYEGEYGGRGSESIQNSIRTVGARQAARTARAYRNNANSSTSRRRISQTQTTQDLARRYAGYAGYAGNGARRLSSARESAVPSVGKKVTKRTEYNRAFKAIGRIREMADDRRSGVPSGDALRRALGNASEEGLRMIQRSYQVSGRTKDFADEILRKLRNGR